MSPEVYELYYYINLTWSYTFGGKDYLIFKKKKKSLAADLMFRHKQKLTSCQDVNLRVSLPETVNAYTVSKRILNSPTNCAMFSFEI